MFITPKQKWFVDLLKEVEGFGGFDGRLWRAFPSVEGGQPTIGYGHKLTSPNVFINGEQINAQATPLTSAQVEELLQQDIAAAENLAASQYTEAGNPAGKSWEGLSTVEKSMFTEIVFNVGTLKNKQTGKFGWKELAKGIRTGDKKKIFSELGRTFTNASGEKTQLKSREKALVKAYKSVPVQKEVEQQKAPDFQGNKKLQALWDVSSIMADRGKEPEGLSGQLINQSLQQRLNEDFKVEEERAKQLQAAKKVPTPTTKNSAPAKRPPDFTFEEGMFQQGSNTFEVIKVK